MEYHESAGIIIYHINNGEREYLLLRYAAGHWGFSKGHIDFGETEQEAAVRELKEETGLIATPMAGFETSFRYVFRQDKELVRKKVTFFVGEVAETKVILSREHKKYVWLPFEKAKKHLTYEAVQQALVEAQEFLKKYNL